MVVEVVTTLLIAGTEGTTGNVINVKYVTPFTFTVLIP